MTPLEPLLEHPLLLCPRCGRPLPADRGPQADCGHCGGCWQTDLLLRDLRRWFDDLPLLPAEPVQ